MAARLKCTFGCNRLFQSKVALMDHKRASHPSGAQTVPAARSKPSFVACNDCHKLFSTSAALQQHRQTTPNHVRHARAIGSTACNDCGATKRDDAALEQHRIAKHSLIRLPESDPRKVKLEKIFISNWRKDSRRGPILGIYVIDNPGWRVKRYAEYKKRTKEPKEEIINFHGTSVLYDLGAEDCSKLCPAEGCGLCGISRRGFQSAKARDRWLRFGLGIYTTATSGKSDDYIQSTSSRRAVLLCRVATGRVFRTMNNMPDLKNPPDGYDSVSGEVGRYLNYDETVVYSNHAILPHGIIVYARA